MNLTAQSSMTQKRLDALTRITNAFDVGYLPQHHEDEYTDEIRISELESDELHQLAHDLFFEDTVLGWVGTHGYPKDLPGLGQFSSRLATCKTAAVLPERTYQEILTCLRKFIGWAEACLLADAE